MIDVLTVQQIVKSIGVSIDLALSFKWDFEDEEAVCKTVPNNTDGWAQTEKGWHYLDTSDSLPG